jgi:hypothetical protein
MSRTDLRLRKPFFDIDPATGISIEVFYFDRTLETFGRVAAGRFWWPRERSFAPDHRAHGPFPTSYSAYRDALGSAGPKEAAGRAHFGQHGDSDDQCGCKAVATLKCHEEEQREACEIS